nr:hypothetical protein [Suicoccus acidiformans]
MYSADVAQNDYDFEAKRKGPNPKIGNNHKAANFIENLIACESYSPYAMRQALL